MHIHIKDTGGEGIAFLDAHGQVQTDGSDVAEWAVHKLKHKHVKPGDGKALLDSIVEKLDRATLANAWHCHEKH